jgi:hypothetical protein
MHYTIKVDKINLYLYDVQVKVNSQEFKSEPPELLNSLFSTSAGLKDLVESASLVGGALKARPAPENKSIDLNEKARAARFETAINHFYSIYENLGDAHRAFLKSVLVAYDSQCVGVSAITAPNFGTIQAGLVTNLALLDSLEKYYAAVMLNASQENFDTKQVNSIMSSVQEMKLAEKYQSFASGLLNLNQNNFAFETIPVKATKEEMNITIYYFPRKGVDTAFFIPLRSDSVNLVIPIKGPHWRWNFSQGIFYSNIYNMSYSYKANLGNTTPELPQPIESYIVERETTTKASAGIAGLAHYGAFFPTTNFSAGGHFGVGLPIGKTILPQFLYGVSLGLGKEYKIVFNLGGTTGLVRRLSNNLDPSQRFKDTGTTIPTIIKLKTGFAVSVTFNFFSTK